MEQKVYAVSLSLPRIPYTVPIQLIYYPVLLSLEVHVWQICISHITLITLGVSMDLIYFIYSHFEDAYTII